MKIYSYLAMYPLLKLIKDWNWDSFNAYQMAITKFEK